MVNAALLKPQLFTDGECITLVFSRKRDESFMIGDNIKVTVVDIRFDKVRLGIEAPTEIPVHREEVYLAIQREHQRALSESKPATAPVGDKREGG